MKMWIITKKKLWGKTAISESVISQHLSSECWHDGLFTFFKNENIKPKKKPTANETAVNGK